MQSLCALKISYVSNHKISITLLKYVIAESLLLKYKGNENIDRLYLIMELFLLSRTNLSITCCMHR